MGYCTRGGRLFSHIGFPCFSLWSSCHLLATIEDHLRLRCCPDSRIVVILTWFCSGTVERSGHMICNESILLLQAGVGLFLHFETAHQPTVANFPPLLPSQMTCLLYFARGFQFGWLLSWLVSRFVQFAWRCVDKLNFRNDQNDLPHWLTRFL